MLDESSNFAGIEVELFMGIASSVEARRLVLGNLLRYGPAGGKMLHAVDDLAQPAFGAVKPVEDGMKLFVEGAVLKECTGAET